MAVRSRREMAYGDDRQGKDCMHPFKHCPGHRHKSGGMVCSLLEGPDLLEPTRKPLRLFVLDLRVCSLF